MASHDMWCVAAMLLSVWPARTVTHWPVFRGAGRFGVAFACAAVSLTLACAELRAAAGAARAMPAEIPTPATATAEIEASAIFLLIFTGGFTLLRPPSALHGDNRD